MNDEIHSCSYFCDKPACIKRQRDALRERARESLEGPLGYALVRNGKQVGLGRSWEAASTRIDAEIVPLYAAPPDTQAPQPVAQEAMQWPVMPKSIGQSPILFEDGYAEGWAKCLSQCKAALAPHPAQPVPQTFFMREMITSDGLKSWYVDAPEFYCEIEPTKSGQYEIFFRDKNGKEGFTTQPVTQPLTDEKIEALFKTSWQKYKGNDEEPTWPVCFCREIEAAHGITPTGEKV